MHKRVRELYGMSEFTDVYALNLSLKHELTR